MGKDKTVSKEYKEWRRALIRIQGIAHMVNTGLGGKTSAVRDIERIANEVLGTKVKDFVTDEQE